MFIIFTVVEFATCGWFEIASLFGMGNNEWLWFEVNLDITLFKNLWTYTQKTRLDLQLDLDLDLDTFVLDSQTDTNTE